MGRRRSRGGFWLTLLAQAFLIVLADMLSPKPDIEDAKPAGLGMFKFPTASEGRAVPLIWGKVRLDGPNVVWHGDLVQDPIKEEIKTGLISTEDIIKGYEYSIGVQFMLCQGPVDNLHRVWIGDRVIYDGGAVSDQGTFSWDDDEFFGGEDLGNGGVKATCRFFSGTASQTVSDYLKAFQKQGGVTPAYHDICYVAPDEDPFYVGNSEAVKPWGFEVSRFPDGLGLGANKNVGNGANCMNVIYEAMTNLQWGLGIPTGDINVTNFTTAATTLATEGNGFAFVLDNPEDILRLIQRVEQQIDGVVYQNPATDKWEVKLVRDDFDIDTVRELDAGNCKVLRFTRGTWEGTKNQVRIPFNKRPHYKRTFGFAQDMANVKILGVNASTTISHPGIKTKSLANKIAWRELIVLSRPLAQGSFECDRTFYDTLPGDVLALTDADLGLTKLPMRVKDIDFGEQVDGKIIINAVEDVFSTPDGVFADPPDSGWDDPDDEVLGAFPAAQQLAIEAPRAITHRDPLSSSATTDRVWVAARRQTTETQIRIRERHAAGTPAGSFADAGTANLFALIGQLNAALTPGASYSSPPTITINSTPDTQAALLAAFPTVNSDAELGTELLTLCYIASSTPEFVLVRSVVANGGNVDLVAVFRGVLDTPQVAHPIDTDVFLLFVGAGVTSTAFPAADNVDILLLPRNINDELVEGSATEIAIAPLQNRTRRPYPPSEFDLNSVRYDDTLVDLDGSGSGENVGVLVDSINIRDHRTAEGGDEVAALSTPAGSLGFTVSDFTLTHNLVCFNGGTELTGAAVAIGVATTGTIRQLDILEALDATTLPASLTFGVRATHVFETVSRDSLFDTLVTSTLVSGFIGKTAFGALNDSETSAPFTVVADTVDHVFTLSTVLGFDVEYNINGGGFVQLIAAGLTTGTIANALLTNTDLIRIRHLDTGTGFQKLIDMKVSSVIEAYGVLIP